jgi:uncharacterized protein (TIGR02145 family)
MGGLEEPKTGALLDLNSTVKGGLLLSNVVLDNLYTIPHDDTNLFPGVDASNYSDTDVKTGFTGALVYHTGGNNIPAGIYVWNGTNWTPLAENCTAPVFTLTAPPFIKKGANAVFSVASDASARCAEGETYDWFQTTAPGNPAYGSSIGTTASVTTSFTDVGSYKVKVEAATPYSSSAIVEEKEVNVTADGGPDPSKLTSTYGIVGETCLDVKKTGQDKTAIYADRKDGFPGNNYAKTYKFHHGNSYSDLVLALDDPDHLVDGITAPPASVTSGAGEESITVTFRSNVKDLVPASGNSMTVKLYASYKPAEIPAETRYAYLEIRVEDGTCICPARIDANTWLNFMCHNLGGIDIISPSQLITYGHHGNWYRFGAKNPSLVNTGTNNGSQGWGTGNGATPRYYAQENGYSGSGTWDWPDALAGHETVIGNPCPAGWRLPTDPEWTAVTTASYNPQASVPVSWTYNSDAELFSHLKKLGDDLMLPAAGLRYYSGGSLYDRGYYGYYWSSTGTNSLNGWCVNFLSGSPGVNLTSRSNGLSVRCVQAE